MYLPKAVVTIDWPHDCLNIKLALSANVLDCPAHLGACASPNMLSVHWYFARYLPYNKTRMMKISVKLKMSYASTHRKKHDQKAEFG